MRQDLSILGQQGDALYAQDSRGRLWYKILPHGEWSLVAF